MFGPVVAVGDGGKYVEALGDVRLLIPPFGPGEVLAALEKLRIAALFRGVRGDPPLDTAAYCQAAVLVAKLMLDPAQRVASVDLNPVIVGAVGQGYRVVDALVVKL